MDFMDKRERLSEVHLAVRKLVEITNVVSVLRSCVFCSGYK